MSSHRSLLVLNQHAVKLVGQHAATPLYSFSSYASAVLATIRPARRNTIVFSLLMSAPFSLLCGQIVRTTLEKLVLAVKGEIVMSPELDKVGSGISLLAFSLWIITIPTGTSG